MGIATDIDDGKPDEYDLPPPTTAGAVAPANGVVDKTTAANGIAPEEERWARDKVGWAPRFGDGMTPAEREDTTTLLDHQTFLEGRLDESLFGDWYHNAAVIIFACLSSWVIALLGGGLGWVFIIMATCGTYYRTSLRRVRRNFRDDISRELAKTTLEQDTESLEWMNSFLVKFWPIYAPNLAESIVASVDQVLSTSTPAFLDSMRMKTFILGTKPPRMEHVRTYPKTDEDIVMMDWKFSFTPTDTMDLTARQLKNKINPKVVLEIRIGKAMISKAMDIIVEDFCFSGLMRLKIKLQLPFPFVEKIDMCFMERPEIDCKFCVSCCCSSFLVPRETYSRPILTINRRCMQASGRRHVWFRHQLYPWFGDIHQRADSRKFGPDHVQSSRFPNRNREDAKREPHRPSSWRCCNHNPWRTRSQEP